MIKIEKEEIGGFNTAIRGMRNPWNSWDKSDSFYGCDNGSIQNEITDCKECLYNVECCDVNNIYNIGKNDLELAQQLVLAGSDHSKFMRQIYVSFDLTAPLYFWKEFDTYKVGTVANSTSTMHTLSKAPLSFSNFSFDATIKNTTEDWVNDLVTIVSLCESYRRKFKETGDKGYWRRLIQILPESYNQTRTVSLNYAVLRNMYFARKNHKLEEWTSFCKWIETLPYAKELICLER